MSRVEVGMSAPIKGRLPNGWRIEAHFAADLLKITSPDTTKFTIYVETNNMDEYGADYKKTSAKLDKDSYVNAKYDRDSGVLRFDSTTYPEFWIEVTVDDLEIACKKQKMSSSDDDEQNYGMPWSKIEADGVLTLWPGTCVREPDFYGPNSLHIFFEKAFDIEVTPVGCVTTLPDVENDQEVKGTGGRIDFFFFVKMTDVPKFAVQRFRFGMRWWEDVFFNDESNIYPVEFRKAYPDPAHVS